MTTFPQFFAGIMLLCALGLLVSQRLASMIVLYRCQALALFATALALAFSQGGWGFGFVALVTLGKAISFPVFLRRFGQVFKVTATGPSLLTGLGLICVAMLAALPLHRPILAIVLAILLLGFFRIASRRNILAQLIGFLCVENALMLAAISIPALPFLPGICLALAALSALLVAKVFCIEAAA